MSGKQRYLLRVRLLRSLPNVHTTRHPPQETYREYERVVDAKYLDQIRTQAKQFSTRSLSRQSGVAAQNSMGKWPKLESNSSALQVLCCSALCAAIWHSGDASFVYLNLQCPDSPTRVALGSF